MINELIIAGVSFFHPAMDSIGMETVNGKVFVLHKVEEKETLYAIARRYGATVDAIRASNAGLTSTLEIGQVLKVPYTKSQTRTSAGAGNGIHKVQPKETMYSISKAYGVSIDDLKKWNNLTDNTLSVGQELYVRKPSATKTTAVTPTPTETRTSSVPANGQHTVQTKETLFSIARQYDVTVAQLRSWNNLTSDELQVGQVLNVSGQNKTTPVIATTPVQETVAQTEKKKVEEKVVERTPERPVERTPAETRVQQPATTPPNEGAASAKQTIRISESLKNSDEISETGIAELIEGTEGNRKYLALHRTAPVGTILKVKNEMNNREVFVRVMGKLPDTTINDKVLIRISRSAYDRLGAIDPRFRVELTYYK